jgi:hypothetical protein
VLPAVEPLRGQWASALGWTAPFFHLLGLIFVPGLVMAAPIAFSLEGMVARRVSGRRSRLFVPGGGALAYALLSGLTVFLASLGSGFTEEVATHLRVPLLLVLPVSALSVFGFWLPSIACGAYATFAERPKWWVAGLVGTATLIAGVWLWILLGTLVNAPTD